MHAKILQLKQFCVCFAVKEIVMSLLLNLKLNLHHFLQGSFQFLSSYLQLIHIITSGVFCCCFVLGSPGLLFAQGSFLVSSGEQMRYWGLNPVLLRVRQVLVHLDLLASTLDVNRGFWGTFYFCFELYNTEKILLKLKERRRCPRSFRLWDGSS